MFAPVEKRRQNKLDLCFPFVLLPVRSGRLQRYTEKLFRRHINLLYQRFQPLKTIQNFDYVIRCGFAQLDTRHLIRARTASHVNGSIVIKTYVVKRAICIRKSSQIYSVNAQTFLILALEANANVKHFAILLKRQNFLR